MSISFFSPDEINLLQTILGISNFEVVVHPNWGSRSPGHREDIHGELKRKMAHAYPLCDASISHCPSLGGFAFITYDYDHVVQLGFDIEEDLRVKPEVARRICQTQGEYDRAPSPASLWAAKEAAYKALKGPKQPAVVSDLELGEWKIVSSQVETVWLKDPQQFSFSKVIGVLVKRNPYTLAFFISLP